jgi:hypothetical protein
MVYVHIKAPKVGSEEYWPIMGLYTVLFSILAVMLLIFGIADKNAGLLVFGALIAIMVPIMIWAAIHDDRKYKEGNVKEAAAWKKYSNTIEETAVEWDDMSNDVEFTPVELSEEELIR